MSYDPRYSEPVPTDQIAQERDYELMLLELQLELMEVVSRAILGAVKGENVPLTPVADQIINLVRKYKGAI